MCGFELERGRENINCFPVEEILKPIGFKKRYKVATFKSRPRHF